MIVKKCMEKTKLNYSILRLQAYGFGEKKECLTSNLFVLKEKNQNLKLVCMEYGILKSIVSSKRLLLEQ